MTTAEFSWHLLAMHRAQNYWQASPVGLLESMQNMVESFRQLVEQ